MLKALRHVLDVAISPGLRRDIILITDGEVGDEDAILSSVKKAGQGVRFFTVGIGYGPNEYLIKECARRSGGVYELIAPGGRIGPRVLGLYRRMTSPSVGGPQAPLAGPGRAGTLRPGPVRRGDDQPSRPL